MYCLVVSTSLHQLISPPSRMAFYSNATEGAAYYARSANNALFGSLFYMLQPAGCTQGMALANLAPGAVRDFVGLAMTIDLLFTAALFILPVAESIEQTLFSAAQIRNERECCCSTTSLQRNLMRVSLVALAALVAVEVRFFELLSGLSGGFGQCLLGLVLPPIFYYSLQRRRG